MNPVTAATLYATLIGLLCNYRQERGADKDLDHRKFIEWLEYHQHEDIKQLILNTYHLQSEVDQLLRADHILILKKLDALGTAMASLSSGIAELSPLAMKLVPAAQLSEQALSLLRQLVNSDVRRLVMVSMSGFTQVILENNTPVEFTDPRFLEDDLRTLVSLDLLTFEQGSDGITTLYGITRNAVALIASIDGKG